MIELLKIEGILHLTIDVELYICCIFVFLLLLLKLNFYTIFRNLPSLAQESLSTVIKVVHGTEEVHSTIRKVCVQETSNIDAHNPTNKENTDGNTNDNEGVSETNVNGVWTLSIGSIPFDKDFEGIKVHLLESSIITLYMLILLNTFGKMFSCFNYSHFFFSCLVGSLKV